MDGVNPTTSRIEAANVDCCYLSGEADSVARVATLGKLTVSLGVCAGHASAGSVTIGGVDVEEGALCYFVVA